MKTLNLFKTKKNILNRKTGGEKVVYALAFVLFAIYALSLLLPLFWLFYSSFKDGILFEIDLVTKRIFSLPKEWLFSNYIRAFEKMSYNGNNFLKMLFNSIWYMVLSVGINIFMNTVTGYVVSRYKNKGTRLVYAIVIFTMTIPIVGSSGAFYKLIYDIGLYDTPLFVIITSMSGFGFNFLVMYGIFSTISWSYAEAVFIDGGGHYTVFFKIMLPQVLPSTLTLAIMASIGAWNEYLTPILYLPSYPTVASGLYFIQAILVRGSQTTYFAGLVISIIPVIIVFSFFSGIMMKNISIGGLKG